MPLRWILPALVVALAVPAGAQASLSLEPLTTNAVEQPAGDGLLGPGDGLSLTQTLLSSEPSLTGLSGHLTSQTPGVTVTGADAAFPDVSFGNTTTDGSPFSATIDPSVRCGTNLDFTLGMTADQGTASIPLTIGTGAAGPMRHNDGVDVPQSIPDGGSIASSFTVTQPGLVKNVRITIGRITHTYDGDLKIWIEAPDGTTVTLVDHNSSNDGDDFINTTFALDGANIASATAPFTGTFRAAEDLHKLIGHEQQGTWTLHVADMQLSDTGTLVSWGADIAQAVCDGNPIASFTATPRPVAPGATVTLDGSGSIDPNGTIADYAWDLDGNGTYETDTGTTPTTSTSFPVRGSHLIGLRITDNEGHTDATTLTLPVTQPPVAAMTATPAAPTSGDSVSLDASASHDPDGSIVNYAWDLDGNGSFERSTGTTSSTTTSFATPGVHTVRVRVTDDDGATAVRSLDITVANRPPTARLTGPDPAVTAVAAVFDAGTSSDADGSIVRYQWDLDDDGTYEVDTGPVASVSKTWSASGTHTVRVRVTDDQGSTDSTSLQVFVDAPPLPSVSASPSTAPAGSAVTLSGAGSTDPDGTIARYEWDLDNNGTYEVDGGHTADLVHVFSVAGSHPVRLRVTDDRGISATASVTVTTTAAGGGTQPGGTGGSGDTGGGPDAGGGSGAGGGGTGGGGPTAGEAAFSAGLFGAPIQGLKLARRHGLTLACRVVAPARCTITVLLRGADAVRLGLTHRARSRSGRRPRVRDRIVGRGVVDAQPGKDARVLIPLSLPLRRALAHARGARLLVRGTAVDTRGRTVALARVVLLRR